MLRRLRRPAAAALAAALLTTALAACGSDSSSGSDKGSDTKSSPSESPSDDSSESATGELSEVSFDGEVGKSLTATWHSAIDAPDSTTVTTLVKGDGDEVADGDTISAFLYLCLLYTSPSPRDGLLSRMPSSA